MGPGPDRQRSPAPRTPQTASQRGWTGLDLADSRLSLGADKLAWCDGAMPVGQELQSLPIYAGPLGPVLHASTPKNSLGCSLTYGAFVVPHPVAIVVYDDGSAYQRDLVNDGAVDVQIAPPGTFGIGVTAIRVWRDGPVLFLDQQAGYCKWDGTTFTVINGALRGYSMVVFDGHAWLVTAPRTITYTAPDTFDDFTGANGAGAFRITDDAFEGIIVGMRSTVQQLWILGASAIDALGGVQTFGGVTTFSVTNAVNSVGMSFSDNAVGSYFRLLTFPTGTSIYGLLGVTPQPLSQPIDRLFSRLAPAIEHGPSVGIQQLNGRTVLVYLYDYDDPIINAHRSLLLCFDSGRWFLASPPTLAGHRILDMVTLTVSRTQELYGLDEAGHIHRIFARAADAKGGLTGIFFRFDDFGSPMAGHTAIRVGLDLVAPQDVSATNITVALVSEANQQDLQWPTVNFQPMFGSPLGLRYALTRKGLQTQSGFGERLGISVVLNSADRVAIAGVHLLIETGEEWD